MLRGPGGGGLAGLLRARARRSLAPRTRRLATSTGAGPAPVTGALRRRVALFEAEQARQEQLRQQAAPGGEVEAVSRELAAPLVRAAGWAPIEALKHLPRGAADDERPVVAVRVNGVLQGLYDRITAPGRAQLDFVRFGEPDGTAVYWHSAAHVTGASLEAFFGDRVQLCDGPATLDAEGGYFYEMHLLDGEGGGGSDGAADIPGLALLAAAAGGGGGAKAAAHHPSGTPPSLPPPPGLLLLDPRKLRITEALYPHLEAAAKALVGARLPFQRLEVTPQLAASLFEGNPFKLDMLARIPPGEPISLYRCGPFVDLCRGPHVPHTGYFKGGLRINKSSGSHWQSAAAMRSSGGAGAAATAAAAAPPPAPRAPVGGELLQRVYGIAFPTSGQLAAWQAGLEEARRRDHRVIGRAQGLFFFHDLSPGSAFMLPHGTRIYNALVALLRREYRRRGYEEVMTPLLYKPELWATSGHLAAYGDNMFTVVPGMTTAAALGAEGAAAAGGDGCAHAAAPGHGAGAAAAAAAAAAPAAHPPAPAAVHHHHHPHPQPHPADEAFGLKPMNCPGHCLVFAHRSYSYRELPVRLADFSSLHRNEASGSLGGLMRLRRFQQDDAHIFCGEEHIRDEVHGCLEFVRHVYRLFGFTFRAKLSTRPLDNFVGDVPTWERAEAALLAALQASSASGADAVPAGSAGGDGGGGGGSGTAPPPAVEIDAGGGAFYGPKIDVFVRDALGREHQCATVQLDFQLPRRFGLAYDTPDGGTRTPVIIHRAILGSLERMMGILIEHTGGRWPFWLSPRQVQLVPVASRHAGYARRVAEALRFPGGVAPAAAAAAAAGATAGGPVSGAGGAVVEPPLGDSGLWVDVDDSANTLNKKVRGAQVAQYNLILVVGDAEEAGGTATVRFRDPACQAAFETALRAVAPHAAGAGAAGAAGAGAAGAGAHQPRGGGCVEPPPAAALLQQLPIATIRATCEEMLRRHL